MGNIYTSLANTTPEVAASIPAYTPDAYNESVVKALEALRITETMAKSHIQELKAEIKSKDAKILQLEGAMSHADTSKLLSVSPKDREGATIALVGDEYTIIKGSIVVKEMTKSLIKKEHRVINMRNELIASGIMEPKQLNDFDGYQLLEDVKLGESWSNVVAFAKGYVGGNKDQQLKQFIPFGPTIDTSDLNPKTLSFGDEDAPSTPPPLKNSVRVDH